MKQRTYIAIDLKSFYASVECRERHLNPLTTNLVVADESRTDKTICLAVSPSLKSYGVPGRPRLFEVKQKVKEVNRQRMLNLPYKKFTGKSYDAIKLQDNSYEVDFLIARPRMAYYIEYSTRIYDIYLKYIAPEDIHVYSIDEVFMDVTEYLHTYNMTGHQLAMTIIKDVLNQTGITATAGIGTNLYLAKVAMDIVAKHMPADKDGVRIAQLDMMSYRKKLWGHTPLTDFWRVGKGYTKKLEANGMECMGDVARMSIHNEELLYKLFGVNAELLIDHAWGIEPCTIKDIKAYKPESKSLGTGQVLHCPYSNKKARLVLKEMTDGLVLSLVEKHLATDQIVLTVNYDRENLAGSYNGQTTVDAYGRKIPKHGHGTINFDYTSSLTTIMEKTLELYDRITEKHLTIRKLNISANHLINEERAKSIPKQISLFDVDKDMEKKSIDEEKEKRLQEAILSIKNKYGKNSVLKAMNLEEGATGKERNDEIGGHKA